jgi:transposase InsO family protein
MCRTLKVSESGYYRWLKNRGKKKSRQLLLVIIKEIIKNHPDNDNYGVERILTALSQKGIKVSRRTVYRVMEEGRLLHKRRTPRGITKATTEVQEKENLIKRDFKADKPITKLLTDITEVQCSDGKLYVSPILDCCNGEIVALEMRSNMKKELCINTVKQLHQKYGKLEGTILHSDRGSQYTSAEFRDELKNYGIIQSLSGAGHCYDNARMESFFATLKKEKLYRIPTYRMTRDEVKSIIFRYIFGYYNTQRITSFNPGGWPPIKYRELLKVAVA